MNKLLVICGPTAIGKTALGIKLAKKLNGEIVSADSRQVYKGMDIGTGKDIGNSKLKIPARFSRCSTRLIQSCFTRESQVGKQNSKDYTVGYRLVEDIPIWLVDVCLPDEKFSVAHWVKFANLVIKDIWKRKKLPIIVGGTGFWIKALTEEIDSIGIPQDWKLRKKLSNYPIVKLSNLLKKLDPKKWRGMNKSDRKNPHRLIRAIEIARVKEQEQIKRKISQKKAIAAKCDILLIGLKAENKVLYQRIDKRVDERVKAEVEKEIKNLLKAGYSFRNSVLGTTIGYKEWRSYIKNSKHYFEESKLKEEVIQRWKFSEHAYARRQMTWFKKMSKIKWFEITKPDWQKDVVKLITSWYYKNNGKN